MFIISTKTLPLYVFFFVLGPCFMVWFLVPFLAVISLRKRQLVALLCCSLISCDFSILSLPHGAVGWSAVCFVCFDSLCPSQQFFSQVGMGLPRMNQY